MSVAIVPFNISAKITTMPAFLPKTRKEFVAPKLPLPCSRISMLYANFPTIKPEGMEPNKYAIRPNIK